MNPPTRIRDVLDAGGVALGARTQTFSPAMIETYGRLGLDFVWIDLEHGGPCASDATAVAGFVRAAEAGASNRSFDCRAVTVTSSERS